MSEPETILAHAARVLRGSGRLAGRRVVVTAGPTRESIDPVRVVTNRSSGKMGYRVAEAAWERGADVVLISGPVALAAAGRVSRCAGWRAPSELEAAVRRELPDRGRAGDGGGARPTSGPASPATSKRAPDATARWRFRWSRRRHPERDPRRAAARAASSSASRWRRAMRWPRAWRSWSGRTSTSSWSTTRWSRAPASSTTPTGWRSSGRDGTPHDPAARNRSARWRRRSWTRWSGPLDELGGRRQVT